MDRRGLGSVDARVRDPSCTCPYDGPGACKHVVAVALSLTDELPADDGERIDAVLEAVDSSALRAFVRDELARDGAMCDRFFATFDATDGTSHEAYRDDVAALFEEHTREYPVVFDAIDFSQFTDLGERYRTKGDPRQAVAVYRGLVAGIDDHITLVDGSYDHYASVFRDGLDGFLECTIAAAEVDASESSEDGSDAYEEAERFLLDRLASGADVHRRELERALSKLRDTERERR